MSTTPDTRLNMSVTGTPAEVREQMLGFFGMGAPLAAIACELAPLPVRYSDPALDAVLAAIRQIQTGQDELAAHLDRIDAEIASLKEQPAAARAPRAPRTTKKDSPAPASETPQSPLPATTLEPSAAAALPAGTRVRFSIDDRGGTEEGTIAEATSVNVERDGQLVPVPGFVVTVSGLMQPTTIAAEEIVSTLPAEPPAPTAPAAAAEASSVVESAAPAAEQVADAATEHAPSPAVPVDEPAPPPPAHPVLEDKRRKVTDGEVNFLESKLKESGMDSGAQILFIREKVNGSAITSLLTLGQFEDLVNIHLPAHAAAKAASAPAEAVHA